MKQIGLGMTQYQQDYDERVVPYRNAVTNPYTATDSANLGSNSQTNSFANQLLNPYIKSDQVWACPSNPEAWVNVDRRATPDSDPNFRSYGGQDSYGVNNYAMQSNSGARISTFPETAATLALVDARYYNVLPKGACQLVDSTFNPTTGSYPNYWRSLGNSFQFRFVGGSASPPTDDEAETLIKARHMETLNVLFLDGHAKSLNWGKVVNDPPAVGKTNSMWDPFKKGCQ